MIHIELSVQMITLVLHYARQKSADLLRVTLHILVGPRQAYVLHSVHILAQTGQAQTPFRATDLLAVEHLSSP